MFGPNLSGMGRVKRRPYQAYGRGAKGWKHVARSWKGYGRTCSSSKNLTYRLLGLAGPELPSTLLFSIYGRWMCSTCGACFKKRGLDGCAVQGRRDRACPGRWWSFARRAGPLDPEKRCCSRTNCQPASKGKRQAQWVAINEKQIHTVSKEPSRDFKNFVKSQAFVLGRLPQDLCPDGWEASGVDTQRMSGVRGRGDARGTGRGPGGQVRC